MSTAFTRTSTIRATYGCQVANISPLSAGTFEVELRLAGDAALDYRAGQYLTLELDVNGDGQRQSLSYSIANSFDRGAPRRLQLSVTVTAKSPGPKPWQWAASCRLSSQTGRRKPGREFTSSPGP